MLFHDEQQPVVPVPPDLDRATAGAPRPGAVKFRAGGKKGRQKQRRIPGASLSASVAGFGPFLRRVERGAPLWSTRGRPLGLGSTLAGQIGPLDRAMALASVREASRWPGMAWRAIAGTIGLRRVEVEA
jgi:hypothetical protein